MNIVVNSSIIKLNKLSIVAILSHDYNVYRVQHNIV